MENKCIWILCLVRLFTLMSCSWFRVCLWVAFCNHVSTLWWLKGSVGQSADFKTWNRGVSKLFPLCYGVCCGFVLFFLGKMLRNFMLGTQSTQRSSCKASGKTLFWPTTLTFHCCGLHQHKIRHAQLCCCGDPLWKLRLPKVVYFHLNLAQVVWSIIIL